MGNEMKDAHLTCGEAALGYDAPCPLDAPGHPDAWADAAAHDGSLRQALRSSVLRPLLQPSPWAASRGSGRSGSRGSGKARASLMLGGVARRQQATAANLAQLRAAFARQLQHGCGRSACDARFCRSNARYAARLRHVDGAALALELARQALEQRACAELQPHGYDDTVDLGAEPDAEDRAGPPADGAPGALFMGAFARAMQRRLGGQRAADDHALALGVSRLDAQTAPLVAAIGGRLLRNTVELVFSAPRALARSFERADASGVDVAAAAAFFERLGALVAVALGALRRSLAAVERGQADAADARHVLALAALLVGVLGARVPAADATRARRQITRLAVCSAYPHESDENAKDGEDAWFMRFTRDGDARRVWVRWWARVPAGVARWWAAGLRLDAAAAAAALVGGLTSDGAVAARVAADPVRWTGALELLRLLGAAQTDSDQTDSDQTDSDQTDSGEPALDPAHLTCPEFLAQFDLSRELQQWLDGARGFGPLLYPFAFSLGDKRRLLAAEAYERMRRQYLGAHDRQAELLQSQRLLNIDTTAEQAVRAGMMPAWPLLAASSVAVARASCPYFVLSVRRARLVQDAVDMVLAGAGRERFPLKVRFVAGGEDGVDMGGVQKELFAALIPQLLAPDRGLFEQADGGALWPRAASAHALRDFEAAGTLLGLAFANGIALHAPLAPLLVRQLAAAGDAPPADLDALLSRVAGVFPELVVGLRALLDWDEARGRVEDVFCRAFDVTVADPLRVWPRRGASAHLPRAVCANGTATFALVPGGSDVDVTAANRRQYVRRYAEFLGYEYARAQIDALRAGFLRAADGVVFRMLRADELERCLCAPPAPLEACELERIATYDDEYSAAHPVVRRFWRVVGGMSPAQLQQLLAFVTADDSLPLGGYADVTFVVQRNGPDSDRLPTALTCFGRLLLPAYASDDKMRQRLLTAIENASGFGLV